MKLVRTLLLDASHDNDPILQNSCHVFLEVDVKRSKGLSCSSLVGESRRICNVPEDVLWPPSLVYQPPVIFPPQYLASGGGRNPFGVRRHNRALTANGGIPITVQLCSFSNRVDIFLLIKQKRMPHD